MTLLLALACTHTPPKLWHRPVQRADLPPAVLAEPQPQDLPHTLEHFTGDPAPDVDADGKAQHDALLVPPVVWARLQAESRRAEQLTAELRNAYADHDASRAHAEYSYGVLWEDYRRGQQREQGLRVAVSVAGLLGGLIGAGVAVGIAWGLPR